MSYIIGVNKRFYPSEFNQENSPPTVCVLVAGEIGDYAAYVGHGSPAWVARFGDKISFQEAQVQFLAIEEKNYRS